MLELGRACVVLALWDLKGLLERGAQGPLKKAALRAARKVLFFVVWSNEQASQCCATLRAEVGVVRAGLASVHERAVGERVGERVQHKEGSHTLIEEL